MPQLLLGLIVVITFFAFSRKARAFISHPGFIRALLFFFGTLVAVALLGVIGLYGWYWWSDKEAHKPQTHWQDSTIWQDTTPPTPHPANEPPKRNEAN
jgi:hypothetical protein